MEPQHAIIPIIANGQKHFLKKWVSLEDFLRSLGLEQKKLAVERNGAIVVRSTYHKTLLQEGDILEIITCVGGG